MGHFLKNILIEIFGRVIFSILFDFSGLFFKFFLIFQYFNEKALRLVGCNSGFTSSIGFFTG